MGRLKFGMETSECSPEMGRDDRYHTEARQSLVGQTSRNCQSGQAGLAVQRLPKCRRVGQAALGAGPPLGKGNVERGGPAPEASLFHPTTEISPASDHATRPQRGRQNDRLRLRTPKKEQPRNGSGEESPECMCLFIPHGNLPDADLLTGLGQPVTIR